MSEIAYSDGRAIENQILGLINDAKNLSSSERIAQESYGLWAVRYHLSPERANLVRHFDFSGLDVLEIGAGMGAMSRFIAEHAKSLTVVEGTESRFKALSARLRDLSNWKGVVANIQTAQLPMKFDVVCVFGVLEYAELYTETKPGESPFAAFLRTARSHLKDGGTLILAIENKLGIKYWSGTEEDHTGLRYDGIVGYPVRKSARTFSRKELKALLSESGFTETDEYFPFPDYKIPSSVISGALVGQAPMLAADLAIQQPYCSNGKARPKSFPDALAVESLAKAGLFAEFSNSFLFVASNEGSETRGKLLSRHLNSRELAWHYSSSRRIPVATIFSEKGGEVLVSKKADQREAVFGSGDFKILWMAPATEAAQRGEKLRTRLLRQAYFGEWIGFESDLKRFIETTALMYPSREHAHVDGAALDATFVNASIDGDGFKLFDLEWSFFQGFDTSWFVFRNVFLFFNDAEFFSRKPPYRNLRALYSRLCTELGLHEDFEVDLDREARFQELVTVQTADAARESLRVLFEHPLGRPMLDRVAGALRRVPGMQRLARSVLK